MEMKGVLISSLLLILLLFISTRMCTRALFELYQSALKAKRLSQHVRIDFMER